jgi:hypothetical protein
VLVVRIYLLTSSYHFVGRLLASVFKSREVRNCNQRECFCDIVRRLKMAAAPQTLEKSARPHVLRRAVRQHL